MDKNLLIAKASMLLFLSVYASPIAATTWHVPGDASSIQGGIDLASGGDTVMVACGTYYEHDIRTKSSVCLRSTTGDAACVTIDAQQNDRVFYCRFMTKATRIEGFTVTGGLADDGGGLYCFQNSYPTFENCVFTGNSATNNGGGVCCDQTAWASFINCTIANNEASNGGSGMSAHNNSDVNLTGCDVYDNIGTGVWTGTGSSLTLTGCTFLRNSSSGIYCGYGSGAMTLTDCTFSENNATEGGGMSFWNSSGTLIDCVFSLNTASFGGGGIYVIDADVSLVHCRFVRNSADRGGAIYLKDSSQGASYVTADSTEFVNNSASISGAHGFVGSGSELVLVCCVNNLSGFEGGGSIIMDNTGCLTPVVPLTWGRLKTIYH